MFATPFKYTVSFRALVCYKDTGGFERLDLEGWFSFWGIRGGVVADCKSVLLTFVPIVEESRYVVLNLQFYPLK